MHSLTRIAATTLALTLAGSTLAAQARPAGTQQQFKGIFEPVSYTEDLDLRQVYFVNAEVGWVSGKSGTILRTIDGGKTWEAQLGRRSAASRTASTRWPSRPRATATSPPTPRWR
jgi:photosystem II stability/assembly factor-like uncharacterized protein